VVDAVWEDVAVRELVLVDVLLPVLDDDGVDVAVDVGDGAHLRVRTAWIQARGGGRLHMVLTERAQEPTDTHGTAAMPRSWPEVTVATGLPAARAIQK
jgi:hypothetical protein